MSTSSFLWRTRFRRGLDGRTTRVCRRACRLGEGNIHAVVGFLDFVENTAITSQHRGETCNCQLRKNDSFDFHLGIGFDPVLAQEIRNNPPVHDPKNPRAAEQTSVVAEMTPHTRDPKWTVVRLNRQRGKQVKVVGQLMLDNVHANTNDDCEFSDEADGSCWRASAWEIHLVTQFLVCKTGKLVVLIPLIATG